MISIKKFKIIQKEAQNRSVSFHLSLVNAVGAAFVIAWKVTYFIWIVLGSYELSPTVWSLTTLFPYLITAAIAIAALDKLTLIMIHLTQIGQKIIYYGIQRFDTWYYLRYRRQGPLTEGIWRIQQRFVSLNQQRKRQIFVGTLSLYTVYICLTWRF